MREIDATLEQKKAFLLVCDRMLDSPEVLDKRRHECHKRQQEAVFGPPSSPRGVIPWVRLPDFQRESLRLIAIQMLKET